MREIRVGKHLRCGCCGGGFQVWEGYIDQDQDNGFGICMECQGWIGEKNEDEWDKAIKVLNDGLNEKNRAKFEGYDREMQKAIVGKALEDGALKWVIGRTG